MANKSIFSSYRGTSIPKANTVNNAGGIAYALSNHAALAQYAATGCMNGTYYTSAENQLETLLKLASRVDNHFLAKTAVYCRENGFMKDVPALLCAILAKRDIELLTEIFPRVIDNGKMLRNFVQIIRSGVTGRKSLGSAPKRLVRQWLERATDRQLANASVGQSPSLADVVKMVHPKPDNEERETFYAWLVGKPYDIEKLPSPLREYEAWKLTKIGPVPDVPFQMLTSLNLGQKEWTEIARNAPWQMTRMNLNTFARHGVFKEKGLDEIIAKRLSNRAPIKRSRVFPYQLLAAYLNADADVPKQVTNALQTALEIATENIPKVPGRVVICTDVSGSMHQAVTGNRRGSTSKVRCLDVAALIAAAILRKNPEALVLPFANDVVDVGLNPRDSIVTNAQKLASLPAGGTNCSAPLKWLNKHRRKADFIFFVSDNESWIDSPNYGWYGGGKTQTMKEWQQIQKRSPKAKMVCLDIQPNASSQAIERNDIMNIGGFSDQVFEVVSRFAKNELTDDHLVGEIEKIALQTPVKSKSA